MDVQDKVKESFDGCRLCLSLYKTPKILHCLHSFCLECLVHLEQTGEHSNSVFCPLCQQETMLRYRGVHGLTTNSFIVRKQYLKGLHLQVQSNYSSGSESDEPIEAGSGSDADVSSECIATETDSTANKDTNQNNSQREEQHQYRVNPASPPSIGMLNYFDFSCTSRKNESLETRHLRNELEENTTNLRSEVLGVTDAIDITNQYIRNWRQRKSDLRAKIQHRSYLLQKQIEDEAECLLEQLENLPSEKEFLEEADVVKQDLHSSLKASLHAIAFSRQILSEGAEEDIKILGNVVNQRLKQTNCKEVFMNIPYFELEVPDKDMANIVSEVFGEISQQTKEKKIFSPHAFFDLKNDPDPEDEENAFETETILVKTSDFSRVKSENKEINNNRVQSTQKSPGIPLSGNSFIAKRPDSISLKSVTDDDMDKINDNSEEKMTFNRFMNLRTSLREKRNKILRAHSDSSSPTSPNDAHDGSITTTTASMAWDAKQALTKPRPRQKIQRHHTISSFRRPSYESRSNLETSYDSLTSPTIPEKPEDQAPEDGHNGDVESMEKRISNVRENIRRRKGSWRSLTLS